MSNEATAEAATKWWSERLQSGDKKAFEEILYPLILDELNREGSVYLECDYDPQGHLLTAVRGAGLECSGSWFSARGILPQKHALQVFPDHLVPKEGYANWLPAILIEQKEGSS